MMQQASVPEAARLIDQDMRDRAEQELLGGMFGGLTRETCCLPHRSDSELTAALETVLGKHAALRSGRVRYGVSQRWVSVDGIATDSEWRELERKVLGIEGIAGAHLRRMPAFGLAVGEHQ